MPFSPHCYLRAPHHRVSGQRAGGGIGPVSQLSLDRERGSDSESTARGLGRAEAPRRGWWRAESARRQVREGHAQGPRRAPADAWPGRCGWRAESLAGCSPAADHQMVAETRAGGSPFAASGAGKAEGHPGSPKDDHHWQGAWRRTRLGTKLTPCPRPGRGPDQIYLESLGHRVRRQRPGGGGREAESLLGGQEEPTAGRGRDRRRHGGVSGARQGSQGPGGSEAGHALTSCMQGQPGRRQARRTPQHALLSPRPAALTGPATHGDLASSGPAQRPQPPLSPTPVTARAQQTHLSKPPA